MNSTEKTRIPKSPNPHVPIDDLDSFLVSMNVNGGANVSHLAGG